MFEFPKLEEDGVDFSSTDGVKETTFEFENIVYEIVTICGKYQSNGPSYGRLILEKIAEDALKRDVNSILYVSAAYDQRFGDFKDENHLYKKVYVDRFGFERIKGRLSIPNYKKDQKTIEVIEVPLQIKAKTLAEKFQ